MERGALFTLPNSISLSRLVLALAFVLVDGAWPRTGLILAAGLTDVLDGWAARRSNSSTLTGALIDPFADRVFVLTAVSTYLILGIVSTAQFFIFLARDLATAIGFVVARFIPGLTAAAFQARTMGKTVTVLQITTLVAALHVERAITPLIAIIGVVSAVSVIDYTLALARARRGARQERV